MEPSLANRPKRAAAERAKPGIKAGVAREEAFQRAAKKAKGKSKRARSNTRRKAQSGQKGNKKVSSRHWKTAGRGRDLKTGEHVGGTEVDGEEVVDAPPSFMDKYELEGNTEPCFMDTLTSAIVDALPGKGGVYAVRNSVLLKCNSLLVKANIEHRAESRIHAINHSTEAEKMYKIEEMEGGGHVLGTKDDHDQGIIHKPPSKEREDMDLDFKEMCKSLQLICNQGGVAAVHPMIIMDAKIEFKDKIENLKHVDHCYIVDLDTCKCVLKGTHEYLGEDMCKPGELGRYFWLVWSIVYHYESHGLGLFEDYCSKLVPEVDWEFMSTRGRKPSEKCIENQRQEEMAAGVSTSSGKRRRHKGGRGKSKSRGKSKKEDNGNWERGMKKRNGAVGKNTNNEEETEQEKRDKMRQLAASAALARAARTD